ncbi:Zn(2)-C6 fungal-type domain-containing protein [Fusarium falciforme]|uniref:Zn(2)-C6 fungal-type domain-containing protein n=1 Tax=Fusarium falciforme TaxID=195108 RepID=UPI002300AA01|nr:Zn(2)-C6 fungal-type domain-containing protein [Fusarium falciforme]WAO96393.1 Zn(2)-C6 fungal-type domain-containing protein [Fusarium falciforme]
MFARQSLVARVTNAVHESERKIDNIARDIGDIKLLLRELNLPGQQTASQVPQPLQQATSNTRDKPISVNITTAAPATIAQWDHSSHVIDFVRAVVEDRSGMNHDGPGPDSESSQVISSLRNLLDTLENPSITRNSHPDASAAADQQASTSMPPSESVVGILRWAKEHQNSHRLSWICKVLPFDMFKEICRKVYFAVDDYTEAEFIIANSFLSYLFAEHAVIRGDATSREYCTLCRSNLGNAISRLPLILHASMEMIAALTLGLNISTALYSVEDSKASRAWTLLSNALSLCQTLGYHRLSNSRRGTGAAQDAQKQLFWAVFGYESGLSLRLGRSSGIRDSDIVTPVNPNEPRFIKVSRVQRQVYDRLYSPASLSASADDRYQTCQRLSQEMRATIYETRVELSEATIKAETGDSEADPMRVIYLQCDFVCQSSLLALILKAIPPGQHPDIPDNCIAVARSTLDMHERCMEGMRRCKDLLLVRKALLNTPFVPFSILFTHAIEKLDMDDFARLERFSASLKLEAADTEPPTHPHRLYELLCKAGRLYISSNTLSSQLGDALDPNMLATLASTEPMGIMTETGMVMQGPDYYGDYMLDLGGWYHDNQQLMSLLDEDFMFE